MARLGQGIRLLAAAVIIAWPPAESVGTAATRSQSIAWLESQTKRILSGSRSTAWNGVTLFTPDASGHYQAQYTRDFYYALAGTPASFWNASEAHAAVNYTFQRQRGDGCMPDKVAADNRTGYAPGAISSPMSDHAWDNGPFATLLLTELASKWSSAGVFCRLEPRAKRALEFLNISNEGLVFNDPTSPNCTYGFTDNIAKTGNLLFSSLLLYDAANRMAMMSLD